MYLDETDSALINSRIKVWNGRLGPRVGDYIRMADGSLRRFTHQWDDGLQTTVRPEHPCNGDSSFYFAGEYMSFSGSLAPTIPADKISPTDEIMNGSCWIFHHDYATAHNAVYTTIPCRVYLEAA